MKFDERGFELPDNTPVAIPVGATEPESLEQLMARMIQRELSQMSASVGGETFEESNDFEIEETEPEFGMTQHEVVGLEEEVPIGRENGAEPDGDAGANGREAASGAVEDVKRPTAGSAGDAADGGAGAVASAPGESRTAK